MASKNLRCYVFSKVRITSSYLKAERSFLPFENSSESFSSPVRGADQTPENGQSVALNGSVKDSGPSLIGKAPSFTVEEPVEGPR